MTAKNAIFHLSREHIYNEIARQTAINALKKQTPKKPVEKEVIGVSLTGYKYKGQCPRCATSVRQDKNYYCHNCGQALDWSDEK